MTDSSSGAYVLLPWWCRTFGHRFIRHPAAQINETRWMQPTTIPVSTFCGRCGTAPQPAAGECTETTAGFGPTRLGCSLQHGHAGKHHDRRSDALWWPGHRTAASDDYPTSTSTEEPS